MIFPARTNINSGFATNVPGNAGSTPGSGAIISFSGGAQTIIENTAGGFDPCDPTNFIVAPAGATHVIVTAHLDCTMLAPVPSAIVGVKQLMLHLFRNGMPTVDELFHTTMPIGPVNFNMFAATPKIPILIPGERWSIVMTQDSGIPIDCAGWLACEFFQEPISGQ